jgi:hypothetical protein
VDVPFCADTGRRVAVWASLTGVMVGAVSVGAGVDVGVVGCARLDPPHGHRSIIHSTLIERVTAHRLWLGSGNRASVATGANPVFMITCVNLSRIISRQRARPGPRYMPPRDTGCDDGEGGAGDGPEVRAISPPADDYAARGRPRAARRGARDLGRAIVATVEGTARPSRRIAPPAEIAAYGSHAVILVTPVKALRKIPGVELIPVGENRALVSLAQPHSIAQLELDIRDILESGTVPAREREALEGIAAILRQARASRAFSLSERTIIVLEARRRR